MRVRKALLAVVAAAGVTAVSGTAATSDIGTASYPWVQPPAWVGVVPAPSAEPQPISYPWVQLPSTIILS